MIASGTRTAWVFVIGKRPVDGVIEQCEFMVYDERLATILRGIFFEKNATEEQFVEFARQVDTDPELAREWASVRKQLDELRLKPH
jgi:hypothetical protein